MIVVGGAAKELVETQGRLGHVDLDDIDQAGSQGCSGSNRAGGCVYGIATAGVLAQRPDGRSSARVAGQPRGVDHAGAHGGGSIDPDLIHRQGDLRTADCAVGNQERPGGAIDRRVGARAGETPVEGRLGGKGDVAGDAGGTVKACGIGPGGFVVAGQESVERVARHGDGGRQAVGGAGKAHIGHRGHVAGQPGIGVELAARDGQLVRWPALVAVAGVGEVDGVHVLPVRALLDDGVADDVDAAFGQVDADRTVTMFAVVDAAGVDDGALAA